MRIILLSNSDSGLYEFRRELIEILSKYNTVLCCTPGSDGYVNKLEELGCSCLITDIERRSTNPVRDLSLFFKYLGIIREYHPDVVLTYTVKPNIYGGIACRLTKTPYISNITGLGTSIENGGLLGRFVILLYKIGIKKAGCVFFQNKNNKLYFEKKGAYGDRVRVIPGSGVNTQLHSLEEYPDDREGFRFLFVGRIMKDKGVEELLQAVEILSKDSGKFVLSVVGACEERYNEVLSEYEKKGLLKYYGKRRDIHAFYKDAHCVVLPSYHEGMSNVMLEAASTGRPVITTRVPGCRETFDEGVSGIGCDAMDVNSLLKAMRTMMNTPWEERRKMGLAGRNKVANEFDRRYVVQAYLSELDAIKTSKNICE